MQEGHSNLHKSTELNGKIFGIKVPRDVPSISHLMFQAHVWKSMDLHCCTLTLEVSQKIMQNVKIKYYANYDHIMHPMDNKGLTILNELFILINSSKSINF